MKNILFLLFVVLLSSCGNSLSSLFSFNATNYSFNYKTFNKKLDYNNKIYLLNTTEIGKETFSNGTNLNNVITLFNKKLGNNVVLKTKYKDSLGKLKIPFPIAYDIKNDELLFLSKNTNLDYIILSKIEYLNNLDKNKLSKNNKLRFYNAKAGAIASIKIISVKKKDILLEMSCSGYVNVKEASDMYTGLRDFQPIPIHKDSYKIGEKAMKKLLKKIK